MRAAVLAEFGAEPVVREVELAEVGADEVLVRVAACGICHSDRTVQLGAQDRPLPLVLGHEVSGVVEQVGPEVYGLGPGDHVVGGPSAFCGRCAWCLRGQPQHCLDKGLTRADGTPRLHLPQNAGGAPVHAFIGLGGFATHLLVSQRSLVRVPPELPLDKAALLGCAVLTGVGAVRHRARVRAGETVAVIGCGGVGLNAVQGARLVGAARIVAVDINPAKLERARRFGATDVVDASAGDAVAEVRRLTGGVDHALEVVGLGRTIEQAFAMTGVRGTTTVVGVTRPGETVTLPADELMAVEKAVQGSRIGSANFRVDVPLYAELYLRGRLDLDGLVSAAIELADVASGLAGLDGSDGARSIVRFA